jgi:hypothetical protein
VGGRRRGTEARSGHGQGKRQRRLQSSASARTLAFEPSLPGSLSLHSCMQMERATYERVKEEAGAYLTKLLMSQPGRLLTSPWRGVSWEPRKHRCWRTDLPQQRSNPVGAQCSGRQSDVKCFGRPHRPPPPPTPPSVHAALCQRGGGGSVPLCVALPCRCQRPCAAADQLCAAGAHAAVCDATGRPACKLQG